MKINISAKNIFLLDGIGAIITSLLLSQVLGRFESIFGMPQDILYVLASIAVGFAIYSLSCHLWIKDHFSNYLKGIAIANKVYCTITLILIIFLRESLTWLGIAYFTGEILVVMGLVSIEWRIANRNIH